jgi:hypothetical protein
MFYLQQTLRLKFYPQSNSQWRKIK